MEDNGRAREIAAGNGRQQRPVLAHRCKPGNEKQTTLTILPRALKLSLFEKYIDIYTYLYINIFTHQYIYVYSMLCISVYADLLAQWCLSLTHILLIVLVLLIILALVLALALLYSYICISTRVDTRLDIILFSINIIRKGFALDDFPRTQPTSMICYKAPAILFF